METGNLRHRREGQEGVVFQRTKGGAWYIEYVNANRRRVREKVGPDQEDAWDRLKDVTTDERRKRNGLAPKVDNSAKLADLKKTYLSYLSRRRRANTVAMTEYALKNILPALASRRVSDLTAGKVEDFIAERVKTDPEAKTVPAGNKDNAPPQCSERTAGIMVEGLKTMLNWAVKQQMIQSNPLAGLDGLKHPPARDRRALSKDELAALLEASPLPYRRLWLMFVGTGMRRNELGELRWSDVQLEGDAVNPNGFVRVRASVAKTKEGRVIPLPIEVRDMIEEIRAERTPAGANPIFPTTNGRPPKHPLTAWLRKEAGLTPAEILALRWQDLDADAGRLHAGKRAVPLPARIVEQLAALAGARRPDGENHVFLNERAVAWRNNLLKRLKWCLDKAGVNRKGVDLHALRYTYGTGLYHAGVDLKTVQTLLGHKTARMTLDIYVKPDASVAAKAVQRLPFLKQGAFRMHKPAAKTKTA